MTPAAIRWTAGKRLMIGRATVRGLPAHPTPQVTGLGTCFACSTVIPSDCGRPTMQPALQAGRIGAHLRKPTLSALLLAAPQLPHGGPYRAGLFEHDADRVSDIVGAQVCIEFRRALVPAGPDGELGGGPSRADQRHSHPFRPELTVQRAAKPHLGELGAGIDRLVR